MQIMFARSLAIAVSALLGVASGAYAADADNGKTVFKKCMACHRVGDGATNLVGPALTGVIGRKAGTFANFAYSATMKAAGDQGLVWDDASAAAYIQDPAAFLKKYLADKGKPELATDTPKMTFKLAKPDGTGDADSAADVVAYLKTFSK